MRYALGIDMGGTKILAGVIDLNDGKVVTSAKRRTKVEEGPAELLARTVDVASEAIADAKRARPEAIGLGVAGQVDRIRGLLISGPNFGAHMDNLPLGPHLREKFKLPVVVANDVEVAAAGELYFGAGKGLEEFVCVFVGTGIGGAIIREKQIYHGASHTAGEIGHIVVDAGGRPCGCGGHGHLEAYASRSAIVRYILGELRAGRESSLRAALPASLSDQPGGTAIRSKILARAVAERDELALEAISDAARFLGAGLASVINFYNPGCIILGGGLIEAVDSFFDIAHKRARLESLQTARPSIEIKRAALGDNAGIVGAAVLAGLP